MSLTAKHIDDIERRTMKATPGPWSHCDKCKCTGVNAADHPICQVTKGKWGDEFPALRLVGSGPLDYTVEPYMEMYDYGELNEETFLANRDFIANAREDVPALIAHIRELEARINVPDVHQCTSGTSKIGEATLVMRLRKCADKIASEVSRTEDDIRNGAWGEIELMRLAADEIERLPAEEARTE